MPKLDIACIIDDDQIFTYLISKQMSLVDFCETTLVFKNGMEAINYFKPILESPLLLPTLILLDLNMPVLDGWQFLDEFRKFKPAKKIAIYIVSSSFDQEDRDKALSYPEVSGFYTKPLHRADLIGMLSKME